MKSIKKDAPRVFISDEGGNTFMIFGLAFVPVMFMIGAATDYTRLTTTRAALQQGTDAALLSVASHMTEATLVDDARKQAQVLLNSNPQLANATLSNVTISADKQTLCGTGSISVPNAFMKMTGVSNMSATINSCAALAGGVSSNTTFEIALVLDNSGSMSSSAGGVSKMDALQTAATSFVNTMYGKSQNVKFSIVPFAAGVVALDPTNTANRNLPWIDKQGNNSQHWIAFGGKTAANAQGFTNRFDIYSKLKTIKSSWDWKGCLEPPTYPNNVSDVAPNPSDPETLFVPYLAPDEPVVKDYYGNNYYNNNYLADAGGNASCPAATGTGTTLAWNQLTNVCKYKVATSSVSGGSGPNWYCPNPSTQTLMQLTTQQSTVTAKIAQLVEGGNTNLHEGFMWGWRTLSPNQPFAGGRSYAAPNNRKVMVFMTDGYNNWASNRNTVVGSTYQAMGYYSYNGAPNNRFPDTSNGSQTNYRDVMKNSANTWTDYWSDSRDMLDRLTLEACTNAKAAGVEIFTIGFSTSSDPIDQQGLDLLKACATNDDHYHKAEDAAQLAQVFGFIGIGLGKLRLSQ